MSSDDTTKKFSGSDSDLLRQILARLETLESGLSALDQKVEARVMDTRPIWEALQVQLAELKATVDEMKVEVGGLTADVGGLKADVDELKDEVKRGFRNAERQTTVLLKEMHKVKTDVEDHEDRLTELERHTS